MAEFKRAAIGLVPLDWTLSALSELCDVRDGTHESPNFYPDGVPFITSKNIVNGKIDLENVSYIRKEDAVEFNKRSKVDQGDILMSMIGTIGMAALVDTIPNFCIKNVALLKPKKISPDYLMQLLDSPLFQKYLAESLDGGIQKFISLSTLRNLEIPFPNSTEQSAIATALSDVDALIAGLEKLIAKKRDLKQATMQQLLTGQTRLPGFSGEWVVKALGDIADLYQPETISQTSFTDHGYPVFGANGVVGMYSRFNHSTPQVTISCRGNCGTVNRTRGPAWITGNAMVVNLDGAEGIDKSYVYHALNYSDLSVLVTGSGIPQIVREPLSKFVINIPADIQEQSAIGSFLSDLDDEIALVEVRLTKTRDLKQGMMQELLTGRTRLV